MQRSNSLFGCRISRSQLTTRPENGPFYSFLEMDLLNAFQCMAIESYAYMGGGDCGGDSQSVGNLMKQTLAIFALVPPPGREGVLL